MLFAISAQQKDDRKLLRRFKWSCILMDEAHLLKDRDSSRRKHLWALAQKAKQRLLLTGTPLQNDLQVRNVKACFQAHQTLALGM